MTRLLVVEDRNKHQKNAKGCLETKFKEIVVDFASSFEGALNMLKISVYDGILADVFLPLETEKHAEQIILSLKEEGPLKLKDLFENEWPYGVLIGSLALSKGLPIVLITDTYHHGKKTEPINEWSKKKGIPLVDRDVNVESCKEEGLDYRNDNENAMQHVFSKKDWLEGFLVLLWMIDGKKKGFVNIAERIQTEFPFGWCKSFLKCMKTRNVKMWNIFHSSEECKESFKGVVKKHLKSY